MAIISSKKHLLWCHIMAAIMRFSFMRNFCCCRDAQTEQLFNRLSWVLTPVMWLLQHSVSKLLRSFIPDVELFYSCLSLEWSSLCIFMLNPWIYNFFSSLIFTAWPATVQFCLFHFPTTGRWSRRSHKSRRSNWSNWSNWSCWVVRRCCDQWSSPLATINVHVLNFIAFLSIRTQPIHCLADNICLYGPITDIWVLHICYPICVMM